MTPDEVRMLDNRYALLFIRGERPVMDFKFDILKHPSVRMTTDLCFIIFCHLDHSPSVFIAKKKARPLTADQAM
ncbi:MAG: hypothetical protein IKC98_01525 [Firmicutes bacterium]|nr:hypothetical protein [Bacillota bacterium]